MNDSVNSAASSVADRTEPRPSYFLLSCLINLLVLVGLTMKLALAPSVLACIASDQSWVLIIQAHGALVLTSALLFAAPHTALLGGLSKLGLNNAGQ